MNPPPCSSGLALGLFGFCTGTSTTLPFWSTICWYCCICCPCGAPAASGVAAFAELLVAPYIPAAASNGIAYLPTLECITRSLAFPRFLLIKPLLPDAGLGSAVGDGLASGVPDFVSGLGELEDALALASSNAFFSASSASAIFFSSSSAFPGVSLPFLSNSMYCFFIASDLDVSIFISGVPSADGPALTASPIGPFLAFIISCWPCSAALLLSNQSNALSVANPPPAVSAIVLAASQANPPFSSVWPVRTS